MKSQLIIYTDGGARSNPGPAAIGGQVLNDRQQAIYEFARTIGVGTNNEAEYQSFLHSLSWLVDYQDQHQVNQVEWRLDSKLVVEQLNHHWKIKEPRLRTLANQAWQELTKLTPTFQITHIPRTQNFRADQLVNQALDNQEL